MINAQPLKSISLRTFTSLYSPHRRLGRASLQLRSVRRLNLRSYSDKMATTMKEANTLRRRMEEGKGPSMGVWQTLPGSNLSRTMARCGFDWIVVDCEHWNIDGKLTSNYERI
jgi:hypothetical protein